MITLVIKLFKNVLQSIYLRYKMAAMGKYRCNCEVPCMDIKTYKANHVETLSNWVDIMDLEELIETYPSAFLQMMKDEPCVRKRHATRQQKIQSGWVPQPPPPPNTNKPFCNKCVVVNGQVIDASGCHNIRNCTFNHGRFDRRAHYRNMYV